MYKRQWLSLALAVRKRKNIPKGMLYQVALLSIICMIWDFATGWNGWSIDYVPVSYTHLKLPVLHDGTGLTGDGELFTSLPAEYAEAVQKLHFWQYYRLKVE